VQGELARKGTCSLGEPGLESQPLEAGLGDADLALIATAHPGVDYEMVARRARLVVDLRGVMRGVGALANVVRL
jgi:UDP-N-acetyl-D-mannosaminuronate dehydrogenase